MNLETKNMLKCYFPNQFKVKSKEEKQYLIKTYKGKRESQKLEQIIDGETYLYKRKGHWSAGIVYFTFYKKDDPTVKIHLGFGEKYAHIDSTDW